MLRITTEKENAGKTILSVEGRLAVAVGGHTWSNAGREAAQLPRQTRSFHVKLCGVSFYRCSRESAAKGDSPAGAASLMGRGLVLNQAIVHEIEEEGEKREYRDSREGPS